VIQQSLVGKAADVYSFAIIMWEILTWEQPYEDMMSVQVSKEWGQGVQVAESAPKYCVVSCCVVAFLCPLPSWCGGY
jgi:hypothetical protein